MRLTAEIYGYGLPTGKYVLNGLHEDIANKLGQLEDIEEERGIDIRILDQALKNGLWYYSKQKGHLFIVPACLLLSVFHKFIYADLVDKGGKRTGRLIIKLSDYGKTWALTKEELEKC